MSKSIFLAACIALAAGCSQSVMIDTNILPAIPDAAYAKGVSAPFCGILDGCLVVAGGANFPEKSLLEGGPKRVYRDIWALKEGEWVHAGLLPDSTAYGATFSLPGRLIFAGGNVCGETSAKVVEMRADGSVSELEPLPFPVEQAGWTQSPEGNLFLVGGAGSDKVLCHRDGKWEQIASLPEPLVQPVTYYNAGKLFVWGGFNPESLLAQDKGLCLDLGTMEWSEAPAIPDGGTFTGATGATLPDGRLAVVGGVNRAIFERALRNTPEDRIPYLSQDPSWYKFRSSVYVFDGAAWKLLGQTPDAALAGPGVAAAGGLLYVSGGELKPGVRSPKSFTFKY